MQWNHNRNLHKGPVVCPSLHLKDSLSAAFFLVLGGLELKDLLFSIEGTVEWRQGKQLLGRIPQLSNNPSSFLELSSAFEDISSMKTGCLESIKALSDFDCEMTSSTVEAWELEVLGPSLKEFLAEPPRLESLTDDILDTEIRSAPFTDNISETKPINNENKVIYWS